MNFGSPIVTIAAVVAGALTSYIVTALSDSARYRRELARHWIDLKLENYTHYGNDVKNLAIVTRQITALHGLHEAAPGIDEDKALALLDEAEVRRSTSYEAARILGDARTIRTTQELNDAAHVLEKIARQRMDADSVVWENSWRSYMAATNAFHESLRRELGVPGQFLPRTPKPS